MGSKNFYQSWKRPNIKQQLSRKNSSRSLGVTDAIKKVLFKCDCEELPLSENQMGYFSDLETLEWFWDITKEEEFQRTKEVTLPSPFETPVNENSTEEGELLVYQEPKTAGNISNADVLRANGRRLLKQWVQTKKSVLRLRKNPQKTGVLFECRERLDFSEL